MKIVIDEHHCVQSDGSVVDDEWVMCIRGWLYGPCEHPDCGGACEESGECECDCHKGAEQPEGSDR